MSNSKDCTQFKLVASLQKLHPFDRPTSDQLYIFKRSSHDRAREQIEERTNAHLLCFSINARFSVYSCFVLSDNREEGPNLNSLVALKVVEDGEKMQLSK